MAGLPHSFPAMISTQTLPLRPSGFDHQPVLSFSSAIRQRFQLGLVACIKWLQHVAHIINQFRQRVLDMPDI